MRSRSPGRPHVDLVNEAGAVPGAELLVKALEALMLEVGANEREATLVLLRDTAMAERNARDRGEEGPTDVLSYPTAEPGGLPFPGVPHLGDILINVDAAARQAAELGHPVESELQQLAAHALMHLLGFDHQTPADWRPFREAQARIVKLARRLTSGENA